MLETSRYNIVIFVVDMWEIYIHWFHKSGLSNLVPDTPGKLSRVIVIPVVFHLQIWNSMKTVSSVERLHRGTDSRKYAFSILKNFIFLSLGSTFIYTIYRQNMHILLPMVSPLPHPLLVTISILRLF